MSELIALGDRAFLRRFERERDARDWARAVRESSLRGVVDVVPAYNTAAVYADANCCNLHELEEQLRGLATVSYPESEGILIELPVHYAGEDLDSVAAHFGFDIYELISLHSSCEYEVFALGFLPGFPYAGYLPPALSGLGRRASPRPSVPRGSVAIAGRQTGVYPQSSPGGWHLIGVTPLRIVDVETGLFPIQAGDRLRFFAIGREEYEARRGELLMRPDASSRGDR